MEQSERAKALESLIKISEQKGYVLYDDVLDCADLYHLPLTTFDSIASELSLRGIILFDETPSNRVDNVSEDSDEYDEYEDSYRDMAHIDYDIVYQQSRSMCPSLCPLIDEIKQITPPQHGEIKRLIPQAQEGNVYARQRIIESQLRQALRIAMLQSENYGYDLSDAFSSACMGLIIAINKYHASEGAFGSYAGFWMFQYIQRLSSVSISGLYVPSHKQDELMECYQAIRYAWHDDISEYEIRNIIKHSIAVNGYYNLSLYQEACNIFLPCLDLDEFIGENEECILNLIPNDEHETVGPADIAAFSMLREQLMEVLGTLTDREQQVLRLRFGLDDGRARTLDEVGQQFNVTRERIRQIEAKALRKLRHPNRSKRLRDYLE